MYKTSEFIKKQFINSIIKADTHCSRFVPAKHSWTKNNWCEAERLTRVPRVRAVECSNSKDRRIPKL